MRSLVRLCGLACLVLAMASSCAPAQAPCPVAAAVPTDWEQHSSPLGFAVQHPRGWGVQTVSDMAVAVHSADKRTIALAVPFLAQPGMSAQQYAGQAPGVVAAILPQGRIVRSGQWSQTPDEVLATMSYDAGGQPGHAALLCSVFSRSGMLYVIAAPQDQYAAAQPVLIQVLRSFRFTQPAARPAGAGAPAAGAIRYVSWTDPNQQAFTVEVPAGWQATGGMYHRNAVDPRAFLQVKSPGDEVLITSGDPNVPVCKLPDGSPFFPEGSDYSPGYGVAMKVRRYVRGADFAREYVLTKLAATFQNIQITGGRERPDVVQAFAAIYARYNSPIVQTNLTMGEATFTCQYQGKPLVGYWFAGTELTTTNMGGAAGGIWHVPHLIGFVAVPQKAALAQEVMTHMVGSTRLNPQWVAMQQGLTANVSGIVADTNAAISKIITDKYAYQQGAKDNASRNWSNMMLGQEDLVDPATGQKYRAASGHNYYWAGPGGDVVGTNTHARPDIDFTPLGPW